MSLLQLGSAESKELILDAIAHSSIDSIVSESSRITEHVQSVLAVNGYGIQSASTVEVVINYLMTN